MGRMIREYEEIGDFTSLDAAIARLCALRDALPAEAKPEIRIRGDEVFGRHLCVAFLRPLTAEEAACEGRYAGPGEAGLQAAA